MIKATFNQLTCLIIALQACVFLVNVSQVSDVAQGPFIVNFDCITRTYFQ